MEWKNPHWSFLFLSACQSYYSQVKLLQRQKLKNLLENKGWQKNINKNTNLKLLNKMQQNMNKNLILIQRENNDMISDYL